MAERDDYFKEFTTQARIVYRYRTIDDRLDQLLAESILWYSSPKDMNDPFEQHESLIQFNPSDEDIQRKLFEALNNPELTSRHDEIKESFSNRSGVEAGFREALKELLEKRGMCCFSKIIDQPFLWGYYGNSQKGVALGYDCTLVRASKLELFDVIYSDVIQPYQYYPFPKRDLLRLQLTKRNQWANEIEVRSLVEDHGPRKINKLALREVIFGCRCKPEDQQRVIRTLDNNGYSVSLKRAVPDAHGLKLVIEDIDC